MNGYINGWMAIKMIINWAIAIVGQLLEFIQEVCVSESHTRSLQQ